MVSALDTEVTALFSFGDCQILSCDFPCAFLGRSHDLFRFERILTPFFLKKKNILLGAAIAPVWRILHETVIHFSLG